MLVHFASGVAGGFSNVFFGLSTLGVYLVATALMALWELGEYLLGVRESWSNRVLDVVVGLAGVQVALWIAAPLSRRGQFVALTTGVALSVTLSIVGWAAFRRRLANASKT
jgi:hypothetical protein